MMSGWDFSKQSGGFNQDPFTCSRCGSHRLSEPVKQGNGYGQTCLDCGRSRMLDPSHPLFNWYQQQTQYPAQLQELNQGRPMNMFGKVAMPVDESWWGDKSGQEPDQWYNDPHDPEEVPFRTLYHGTRHTNLESILTHGLAPWDHPSVNRHNYADMTHMQTGKAWYTPRPSHTYLTNDMGRAISLGNNGEDAAVLEIDPSYLHHENINPDEDHIKYLEGLSYPDARDLPDASLGDYAERVGWGHAEDPTQHQDIMADKGNVAYRGVVPPQAITHVHHSVGGRWTRESVESVMQRMHEQNANAQATDEAQQRMHTYTRTKQRLATMAWNFNESFSDSS